jgi:hypothetical protein
VKTTSRAGLGSRRISLSALRLSAGALTMTLVAACAGGQSGGEGELPAPPCAYGRALIQGTVVELASGCVGVQTTRVLSAGVTASADAPELAPGDTIRGTLRAVYAYRHTFEPDQEVAGFVEADGDGGWALDLMPVTAGEAQIDWAGALLSRSLDALAAEDCPSQLQPFAPTRATGASTASGASEQLPTAPRTACAAP